MKPKKTMSAHVLTVGLMALLIVGSLLVFQVYSALVKPQISEIQQKAIKPLDGNIKEEVINNLVGRRWFNRTEIERPLVINQPTEPEVVMIEDSPTASETGKVEEE